MPHIPNEEEKQRAKTLAMEMHNLIKKNFAESHNPVAAKRVREIRQELEQLGFVVSWNAGIADFQNPKNIDVEVTLYLPKYLN